MVARDGNPLQWGSPVSGVGSATPAVLVQTAPPGGQGPASIAARTSASVRRRVEPGEAPGRARGGPRGRVGPRRVRDDDVERRGVRPAELARRRRRARRPPRGRGGRSGRRRRSARRGGSGACAASAPRARSGCAAAAAARGSNSPSQNAVRRSSAASSSARLLARDRRPRRRARARRGGRCRGRAPSTSRPPLRWSRVTASRASFCTRRRDGGVTIGPSAQALGRARDRAERHPRVGAAADRRASRRCGPRRRSRPSRAPRRARRARRRRRGSASSSNGAR